MDNLSLLKQEPFSEGIKQLEALMSQNNRAFLLGAGCSRCAGLPLTLELTQIVLEKLANLNPQAQKILEVIQEQFEGSPSATIEDYMSELVDLLAITERRKEQKARNSNILLNDNEYKEEELRNALNIIKETIANCMEGLKIDINIHQKFVISIHKILRSGKGETKLPVDYFVLNYDTLIEDALALECIPYIDGFQGGSTAWWDVATFSEFNSVARVLKVHGSIDWCQIEEDIVPRRIRSGGKTYSNLCPKNKVIIWPAATKYQETQKDPFAQILSILRQSLRPDLHSETILTICGYRFNDSHINIEIERALLESDGRLTVLIFTEFNKPEGQIEKWHNNPSITDQIRIYAKKGFFHGALEANSEEELPWWKFENLVRILGGER